MQFNDLSDTQIRHLIDLRQIYEAWHSAERELAHRFAGSMFWREAGGADYLKRKIGKVEKSLGRRSAETEAVLHAFAQGRDSARERHASLVKTLDIQAAIARTVGLGRVPLIVARLLRRLDKAGLLGHVRVVGTNAMFAYEALAGVTLSPEVLATGDIDLLLDARRRLKVVVDAEDAERTVLGLLKAVDHSFEKVPRLAYRAVNKDGFMVDLIRPQPRPAWKREPGAQALADDDLDPSPIEGLQWLVNSPAVSVLAVDGRGYPLPMVVPDPRFWMLHKTWLSKRTMRDPDKKQRDARQALLLWDLIGRKLPQYPLDESFISSLPAPLRQAAAELSAALPHAADESETPPQPDF